MAPRTYRLLERPSTVEVQSRVGVRVYQAYARQQYQVFDVQGQAEAAFGEHINELSAKTLFHESHGWLWEGTSRESRCKRLTSQVASRCMSAS